MLLILDCKRSEVNLASWDRASWHIMNRTGRQPWRLRKEVAHWKGFREVSEGDPLEACNAEKWRKTEVEILVPLKNLRFVALAVFLLVFCFPTLVFLLS